MQTTWRLHLQHAFNVNKMNKFFTFLRILNKIPMQFSHFAGTKWGWRLHEIWHFLDFFSFGWRAIYNTEYRSRRFRACKVFRARKFAQKAAILYNNIFSPPSSLSFALGSVLSRTKGKTSKNNLLRRKKWKNWHSHKSLFSWEKVVFLDLFSLTFRRDTNSFREM